MRALLPAACLVLSACAGAPGPSFLHPEAAAGRRYAQQVCGRCHVVEGGSAALNPRAPPFSDIARRYNDYSLGMEFDAIARSGHFEMRAFVIPPAERKALTAYLLRLRGRESDAERD